MGNSNRQKGIDDARPERRQPHWIVVATFSSLISVTLALLVTAGTVGSAWRWAADPLRPDPPLSPASERIIDRYIKQTREALAWTKPPTVYAASVRRLKTQFDQYDPRRSHEFRGSKPLIPLQEMATSSALYVGREVVTYGEVMTFNIMGATGDEPEGLIQLSVPRSEGRAPFVYCRFTYSGFTPPQPGERLFVSGMAIATGAINLSVGGFQPMTYMACTGYSRPRGKCGAGGVPPIPTSSGLPPPQCVRRSKRP